MVRWSTHRQTEICRLQSETGGRIAGTFLEVLAEIAGAAEAGLGCDLTDGLLRGLQQIQRVPYPDTQKVLVQGDPGVGSEKLGYVIGVIS